jgi:hypothetical protein
MHAFLQFAGFSLKPQIHKYFQYKLTAQKGPRHRYDENDIHGPTSCSAVNILEEAKDLLILIKS